MAERFARKMLPKDVKIFCAGMEPKGVHPQAVEVMQEVGIDISHQRSKNISEIPINKISIVVTLCGDVAERCPVSPGKVKRIHREIDDPARVQGSEEEITQVFRKVRDDIKSYIINYLLVKQKEKWI